MATIVRFHQVGGPENLQFDTFPTQIPNRGEVRLRVQASGLNRAEVLYCRGIYLEVPKLPSRIGYEVAGIVEAVGEGVDRAWIGKQVSTIPGFSQNQYGTLGEEAVVPASALGEYPPNLSIEQAASIWMQYVTAYGGLILHGKVKPNEFVSIPAASSSVGLAAIQMVNDLGATSIAVTRTAAKRDELLGLGAHHVIVSEAEDYVARINEITGGEGVRVTFDPVAGPFVEKLAAAASKGGILIEYGLLSGQPTPFPLVDALRRGLTMRGYVLRDVTENPEVLSAAKKYIYERLADGRFIPKIARTFKFTEVVEAYRYLESNEQVGKVVISIP